MVEREDWNSGKEQAAAPVPSEGRDLTPAQLQHEIEAYQSSPTADVREPVPAAGEILAGLTNDQIAGARFVLEELLDDADDPDGVEAALEKLPSSIQRKAIEVMAARPNLRGLSLMDRLVDRLTLEEEAAFGAWIKGLSQEDFAGLVEE